MKDETYCGWTNYSTWRVNLEYGLLDFYEGREVPEDIDDIIYSLQEYVEESLESNCDNETTLSYALGFIDDVNWYEIASHILDLEKD